MLCIKLIPNKKLTKLKPIKPKPKCVLIKPIPKAQTNQTHPQNLIPSHPQRPKCPNPNQTHPQSLIKIITHPNSQIRQSAKT